MPIAVTPPDPEHEAEATAATEAEIASKLDFVRAAFKDLPATVYVLPNEAEPLAGSIVVEHELVDHASSVVISSVSDVTVSTLVAKFPTPRDRERIERWLRG